MAENNQPLVPTGECTHVGVVVKDLEKAKDFYSKVFRLKAMVGTVYGRLEPR